MNPLLKFIQIVVVIFFIMIQYYSPAQTAFTRDLLHTSWKLQNMTHLDGGQYLNKNELQNEVITFKSDSVWERKRSKDKLEGIWYVDAHGILVIKSTKFNGNLYDLSDRKSFWKIKELDSAHFVLVYLEREGNDIIYIYNSYSDN
jgi:hypothetical protein